MVLTKPLLRNGYKVKENLTVKARVERVYFTEVYLLSDGTFLCTFLNIDPESASRLRNKFDLFTTLVGGRSYLSLIVENYSRERLSMMVDELSAPRGLQCIAGMEQLKALLIADVINPLKNPEKYKRFKLSVPNGILLYGPPGCGKTYIVKKLAEELGYNFIELSPSSVATPFVHGAVSNIAKVFDMAKQLAPSFVFIDEIEGLVPKREELGPHADIKKEEINEFLIRLNNAGEEKILVVGATNRPQMIDTAILRSGRMDKRVFVPPPDFDARRDMLKLCLVGRPHSRNISFEELARMTENYVSSDIELIVTEAARIAVAQEGEQIEESMIVEAIRKISPSIAPDEISFFKQFAHLERS